MQESRSGSFVNFEVCDNFQHFRSESYVQALQAMSVSSPSFGDTRFGDECGTPYLKAEHVYRVSSNEDASTSGGHFNSAPSSPKQRGRDIQKSSTLPNHAIREIGFPKPKKSSSLSIGSFFRKLSPRIKRNKEKKGEKPWIVVEFSQSEIECERDDSSGGSSQSIELATKSKESYIRSLLKKSSNEVCYSSSKKGIARSANDINSGKTPIGNLVNESGSSISFSSVVNTPVPSIEASNLSKTSPRKSLQDLKSCKGVKDSKRSSLIVFDPNSISNRTVNFVTSNKAFNKPKTEISTITVPIFDNSSDVEALKAKSTQDCSGERRKRPVSQPAPSSLKAKSEDFPSVCISKVQQFHEPSKPIQHSLENVSRAQPPRTLNLAASFVDSNCVLVKKMNSMESIGVCSLDACSTTHSEGSLSPSNDLNAIVDNNYTSSAYTLKSTSLILSNGSLNSIPKLANPELRVEEYGDVTDRAIIQDPEKEERFRSYAYLYISPNEAPVCLKGKELSQCLDPGHLPSYLGISCAISGYSGYSRYCHSRDNSPARITSSVNIAKFPSVSSKSSQNFELNHKANDIGNLANSKPRSKTESYICNKYFGAGALSDGKSESSPNFVSSQNITLTKNVNGTDFYLKEMEFSEARPHTNVTVRSNSPVDESWITNGLGNHHHPLTGQSKWKDLAVDNFEDTIRRKPVVYEPKLRDLPSLPSRNEGPKSLVQQRIESLFGQPASNVVQGGVIRASRPKARTPVDVKTAKRSPSCPPQTFRPSSRSPPVFRHITQDFKEQLRNATVPTKNIPVKPMLSPNKQLASLPISNESKREKGACSDAKVTSPKHMLRAASEPKAAFSQALTCVAIEDQNPAPAKVPATNESTGDGHFFIKKIEAATKDIRRQIKEVEDDSKLPGIPEEALGKLLSAAGKANLLIEQKFAQFRSLCEKNIAPEVSGPRPTFNDLAGFWDMVLLQVDNVNVTFTALRQLKARQWKEESVPYARSNSQSKAQPKRTTRASKSNPTTPERSAKASELAKAREEQRKKLMEAKKRGRQQKPCDEDIAIFAPDQATN